MAYISMTVGLFLLVLLKNPNKNKELKVIIVKTLNFTMHAAFASLYIVVHCLTIILFN